MTCYKILALVALSFSLVFLGTALFGDYWISASVTHEGIWLACSGLFCSHYSSGIRFLDVTRTFIIFSCIAASSAGILAFSSFNSPFLGKFSKVLIAAILSFVSAGCVVISMAVYTGEIGKVLPNIASSHYAWSFILGWTAFPLLLIAGALFLAAHVFSPPE
ncbi:lens fiber membrane intrinsic protein-like [Rhinatrema bivittatum]|uniref:lens fiber membrane intrinsic protein-like n=1 Tax=Rhinatrema bivittatum TaxID=194408 RepID=UPI00112DBA95|nr:lens fiber membrane intrinsic protein-like [Rhinatrema bivittatum]XP_029433224.1 lens fiber membrane intrinsic protein-like [Rhinatrema bivittatum]XP_029433225.1 lens fiber membrane intrinsic protein-like [Rhinatrema bivittatum]